MRIFFKMHGEDKIYWKKIYYVNELDINGKDLIKLGYHGKAIGEKLKELMKIKNDEIETFKNNGGY